MPIREGASTGASAGTTSVLPNFYYTAPINDAWSYGIGIGAPFGSSTEYDEGWKGRYGSLESGIQVLDVNPSIAYRVSDKVRLGAGISVQRLSANLTSNVDSSVACFGSVGRVEPSACVEAGLADFGNPELDARGEVTRRLDPPSRSTSVLCSCRRTARASASPTATA